MFWACWCKARGPRELGHSEIHKKGLANKADLGYNRGRGKNRLKREIRMRCSRKLYSTLRSLGFIQKEMRSHGIILAGKYSIELGIRAINHSCFSTLPPINLYFPVHTYHQLSKLDLPEDKGSLSLHSSARDFSTKPQLPS